jgi:predicted nucleotidyltransferase
MAQKLPIQIPQVELGDFCRRWQIRKLSLFGSVLRNQLRPDSDLDVLVEFRGGLQAGLIQMAKIERELSDLVGRKVDLRTAADLSHHFRDDVLREAQVQYAEGPALDRG